MHEYLRSIGFGTHLSKKQLNEMVDWVLQDPDRMSVVDNYGEGNLAMAERNVAPHTGVAVVGEVSEKGELIPEYYFPYVDSTHRSSDAHLNYEHESQRNGYIGMCEDYRMGMAMIFHVRNVTEVLRNAQNDPLGLSYKYVNFSFLASKGTIILPLNRSERVLKKAKEENERREQILSDAHNGDPSAVEALARNDFQIYQNIMKRLSETDVFTVVDSFFMPHGMESDCYYFMGDIKASLKVKNEYTGDSFYRLLVESNGMELTVAINEKDLLGVPAVGCRIKCSGWLTGEMKQN